jgi:hypothetical protein
MVTLNSSFILTWLTSHDCYRKTFLVINVFYDDVFAENNKNPGMFSRSYLKSLVLSSPTVEYVIIFFVTEKIADFYYSFLKSNNFGEMDNFGNFRYSMSLNKTFCACFLQHVNKRRTAKHFSAERMYFYYNGKIPRM